MRPCRNRYGFFDQSQATDETVSVREVVRGSRSFYFQPRRPRFATIITFNRELAAKAPSKGGAVTLDMAKLDKHPGLELNRLDTPLRYEIKLGATVIVHSKAIGVDQAISEVARLPNLPRLNEDVMSNLHASHPSTLTAFSEQHEVVASAFMWRRWSYCLLNQSQATNETVSTVEAIWMKPPDVVQAQHPRFLLVVVFNGKSASNAGGEAFLGDGIYTTAMANLD